MDAPSKKKPAELSIGRNMLWNSAGSLAYLALQWAITIVIVRLSSGYDAAGVLALAMTVFNIFSPLAIYRMYTYQVSDVKRENTLGEYATFRIITCAAAFVGCLVYAALTCPSSTFVAILLYALFKIASLVIDVLHGEDQLNMRMDYIGKSLMLQGIGTFVVFCTVLACTSSIEAAIAGMLVVTCIVGLVYDLPRTRMFSQIKLGIAKEKVLHLLAYCLPIVLAAIACAVVPSVPRQYLSILGGDAALGVYASIAAPAAVIQMGASYIYNPLLSLFSQRYISGDITGFRKLFGRALAAIAALGIAGIAGYMLLGPWILPLVFGESISAHLDLILPVSVMTAVSALLWFANDLLVTIRQFKNALIGNVISLAVAIPSSLFLIPLYEGNGVSFSVIVSYLAGIASMVALSAIEQKRKKK